jgi:hypothetical protein
MLALGCSPHFSDTPDDTCPETYRDVTLISNYCFGQKTMMSALIMILT